MTEMRSDTIRSNQHTIMHVLEAHDLDHGRAIYRAWHPEIDFVIVADGGGGIRVGSC